MKEGLCLCTGGTVWYYCASKVALIRGKTGSRSHAQRNAQHYLVDMIPMKKATVCMYSRDDKIFHRLTCMHSSFQTNLKSDSNDLSEYSENPANDY